MFVVGHLLNLEEFVRMWILQEFLMALIEIIDVYTSVLQGLETNTSSVEFIYSVLRRIVRESSCFGDWGVVD